MYDTGLYTILQTWSNLGHLPKVGLLKIDKYTHRYIHMLICVSLCIHGLNRYTHIHPAFYCDDTGIFMYMAFRFEQL